MINSSVALTEIMLTCSLSLLFLLRCISLVASFASSLLLCLSRLLLLHLLHWWLNLQLLMNIFIFACFDKCWCIINHNDQKIWCCHCVYHLSAVMTHICRAFIKHVCKCKHCFKEKHNCMMNSVLHHLQLLLHYAAWMMIHHFNTCIQIHLVLHLWQWKSE